VDNGDPVVRHPVEDQVSAVNPPADAVMLVPGDYGPRLRHVGDVDRQLRMRATGDNHEPLLPGDLDVSHGLYSRSRCGAVQFGGV